MCVFSMLALKTAEEPCFLGQSRCAQPAILISFVWFGIYFSCFEMLKRFQTKFWEKQNELIFFFITEFLGSDIL